MSKLVISGGHLLDPAQGIDGPASLLIEDGKISEINEGTGKVSVPEGATHINVKDLHVFPGLIDARVYVGEPGSEHRETIASASKAAASGGVTGFIMMPETNPIIDDVALVDFIRRAARETANVHVYPAVAITKGFKGKELSEFGLLQQAGAVMVTEGKRSIASNLIFRRALTYAKDFGLVVSKETNDPELSANGVMNEGLNATILGLPGIPREAEIIPLERDLRLAALTGAEYHAAKISTEASAKAIAFYKDNNHSVTSGISINHLSLNENDIGRYKTFMRLSPPLRSEEDRQAMIEALANGTIDIICSSHDPQDVDTKRHPFEEAADGAIGLETLFAASLRLYHDQSIGLSRLIEAMSTRPAQLFGLPGGNLKVGSPADIAIADLNYPWVMAEEDIVSQSKNTSFEGARFSGKIMQTLVGGKSVFKHSSL